MPQKKWWKGETVQTGPCRNSLSYRIPPPAASALVVLVKWDTVIFPTPLPAEKKRKRKKKKRTASNKKYKCIPLCSLI